MSDEFHTTPEGRGRGQDPGQIPQGLDAEDQVALDRLKALSDEGGRVQAQPKASSAKSRFKSSMRRSPSRRRPAGGGSGGSVARIAAPAVFLVAVIVLVTLMFQSGLIGGESELAVSPSPKASTTKAGTASPAKSATKVYVVKAGDTLSAIAVKFGTSVSTLEELNPDLSASTLTPGDKVKVPRE